MNGPLPFKSAPMTSLSASAPLRPPVAPLTIPRPPGVLSPAELAQVSLPTPDFTPQLPIFPGRPAGDQQPVFDNALQASGKLDLRR